MGLAPSSTRAARAQRAPGPPGALFLTPLFSAAIATRTIWSKYPDGLPMLFSYSLIALVGSLSSSFYIPAQATLSHGSCPSPHRSIWPRIISFKRLPMSRLPVALLDLQRTSSEREPRTEPPAAQ